MAEQVEKLVDNTVAKAENVRVQTADALEEAGQLKLAEHFRPEGWHPKGCWLVDLILGRE